VTTERVARLTIDDAGVGHLRELGHELRRQVPHADLAGFVPPPDRRDPIEILEESNASRLRHLVPVRYGRMLASMFPFYRGSPAVMAHDLAGCASPAVTVQICGDAHVGNFGLYASPERHLLFDVNDFDETLPGPFEWDVRRLVASLVVTARERGFAETEGRELVVRACSSYRSHMARYAGMYQLDVWYDRVDVDCAEEAIRAAQSDKATAKMIDRARRHTNLQALSKMTTIVDGRRRIVDDPPVVEHLDGDIFTSLLPAFEDYLATLQADRRHLVEHYRFVDFARKVVGVGSVGTRCFVLLLEGRVHNGPLFLQVKEAEASVLEPHLGRAEQTNHAQRVVEGQRLMQAASDMFLGWTTGIGHDFYFRQLRDMKGSADLVTVKRRHLRNLADSCGWALARAHARSGRSVLISAYLDGPDHDGASFDDAMAAFAEDYANQTERDYVLLVEAARSRRVEAAPPQASSPSA